jgi:hypothetical protein
MELRGKTKLGQNESLFFVQFSFIELPVTRKPGPVKLHEVGLLLYLIPRVRRQSFESEATVESVLLVAEQILDEREDFCTLIRSDGSPEHALN